MKATLKILPLALEDIEDIYEFILDREGALRATLVFDGLEKSILGLAELSHRGHTLPELAELGFKDVFEIHFKPYRIIYKIVANEVVVHIVVDGRRNLQALLNRRMLRR
jgi:toxin ParE1/3/4